MGRRVLILAAGIGSGHNIAAGVLESCFSGGPEVDEVQKLDILESTNEVTAPCTTTGTLPWSRQRLG